MTETEFTDNVIELATMAGWLVHHDRLKQNVQGHAGFPDLCLVRNGRVIFAELKLDGKEPTEDQQRWLDMALLPLADVQRVGREDGQVFVKSRCWKPSMWQQIIVELTTR